MSAVDIPHNRSVNMKSFDNGIECGLREGQMREEGGIVRSIVVVVGCPTGKPTLSLEGVNFPA